MEEPLSNLLNEDDAELSGPADGNVPEVLTRYFIEFKYKGTAYSGWQIQKNADSVQAHLDKALSTLFGKTIETTGSSRTDTGVHALHQAAHFEAGPIKDFGICVYRLNALLPYDIAVLSVYPVKPAAHSRFDATHRRYEYHIIQHKNPFRQGLAWFHPKPLNVSAMQQAADLLLSHTDYQAFCKVHTDVNNYNCIISRAEWTQQPDVLVFTIQANRFLRGMVRALVGTMEMLGSGKITVADFKNLLSENHRSKAGHAAPAHGLFLAEVGYGPGLRLEE
ncbi:MAG: tRNA pseudouridine(38-40) synthase TruA [Bacteroidota bacterium]